MRKFDFWSWTMQFYCCRKKTFSTIYCCKTVFCYENSKPQWQTTYIIRELGSRGFFDPRFGVSLNSNRRARIFITVLHSTEGEYLEMLIMQDFCQKVPSEPDKICSGPGKVFLLCKKRDTRAKETWWTRRQTAHGGYQDNSHSGE